MYGTAVTATTIPLCQTTPGMNMYDVVLYSDVIPRYVFHIRKGCYLHSTPSVITVQPT